jgi:pseudouridine 5'-phosphatase
MRKLRDLQAAHFPATQPLPGVPELLATLSRAGIELALATSSYSRNYELKTSHLGPLFAHFPLAQRVMGDDPRIGEGKSKPAPDIYLLALQTINAGLRGRGEKEIRPEECLVFEDSVSGVEAGRRAGMRVVWCPHPGLKGEFAGREAFVLAGKISEADASHEEVVIEEVTASVDGGSAGWPSKIDDGWSEYLQTLESFSYERYGIDPGRVHHS